MRTILISMVTALVMALSLQGCGAALSAIPVIISAATTAGEVIDSIESFVRAHNVNEKAVDDALISTRAALVAVLNAAEGAKDLHDQALQSALDHFQSAYSALLVAIAPFGVHAPAEGGRLAASNGGAELEVPNAAQMRLALERQ